jgi:hypothetical protein
MRDRGELSPDADPESLALAMLTAVQGGLLMSQVRHDTVALRTVLDAIIDRIRPRTPMAAAQRLPRQRLDRSVSG